MPNKSSNCCQIILNFWPKWRNCTKSSHSDRRVHITGLQSLLFQLTVASMIVLKQTPINSTPYLGSFQESWSQSFKQFLNSVTNYLLCFEILHSDWLKFATQSATSNQIAEFQSSVTIYKCLIVLAAVRASFVG